MPPLKSSPFAQRSAWRRDGSAALTVTLLGLPQSIAYAIIAGLPVHYGVLGTAFSSIIASFFINSPYVVPGASNATAFLIFSAFATAPELPKLPLMPIVIALTGVFMCLAASFRLSDLVHFISRSVLVGYITGAALLIIANQIPSFAGIHIPSSSANINFFTILTDALTHLKNITPKELYLGLGTALLYLLIKRLRPKWPAFILTFIATTFVTYLLHTHLNINLQTIDVDPSKFTLKAFIPSFHTSDWLAGLAQSQHIIGICAGMALLCLIETSVMSRTLASRNGLTPHVGKDINAVGIANIACSFLSPMPVSGSMTRSILNEQSGAATKWSILISGLITFPIAFLCADALHWIPKAGLAALVIMIALALIKPTEIRTCAKTTKQDAMTMMASFTAALIFPLHVAVFVGVGISIILFLRATSRPELVEYDFTNEGSLSELSGTRQNPAIAIVHAEGSLYFGAADMFRSQLMAFARDPNLKILILRLKNAHHLDATSVLAIEELVRALKEDNRAVLISGVMKDVYKVLSRSGLVNIIGRENIFPGHTTNPNLATRHALQRAQAILGDQQADVRIFVRTKPKKPA